MVRASSHLARRACLALLCFCVAPEFMRQPSDSLLCTLRLLTRTRARSEGVSTPTQVRAEGKQILTIELQPQKDPSRERFEDEVTYV